MRIGFSSLYSWRPHVEHTWYLATLAQQAGHEVFFLTCDADLPTCYTRELRDQGALAECAKCRLGGIRSYTGRNVGSLGHYLEGQACSTVLPDEWAASSASTLGRFESRADYAGADFLALREKMKPAVALAFAAARAWIQREKLDAVCVFNGRMDATRAILEAAKSLHVPVVSHERTWFGDGIQLLPGEHCLGLSSLWKMVEDWKDKALTRQQAVQAASLVARRFLRSNQTEWRAYNVQAVEAPWPGHSSGPKVLILPSSSNEIWGHADWNSGWTDPLTAYEAIIEKLGLKPENLVLRCHPNWAEKIGKRDGALPLAYYSGWARNKGVHCILSHERASTLHLIQQADVLIVASSSAALEGGLLGKNIITIAPSIYHRAGFSCNVHEAAQLDRLDRFVAQGFGQSAQEKVALQRQALRFAYTMVWRFPQYVSFIRAQTTTQYRYLQGADPQRLIDLLKGQALQPDDSSHAESQEDEAEILARVADGQWALILEEASAVASAMGAEQKIGRRGFFKYIDAIRAWSDVGDR